MIQGGEIGRPATYVEVTVRLATTALFLAAAAVAVISPAPHDLPAIALGQVPVYRVEVLLALIYGGLLVLTPLFHGLGGRLPIEISHRGAKWPEPAEEAVVRLQAQVLHLKEERDMLLQLKHRNEEMSDERA